MQKTYTIVKEQVNGDKVYIDYTKINGYKFKPKNKSNSKIKINSLVIIKPSFTTKVLKKKVKKKLDFYLKYMISLIDNETDSTPGDLNEVLGELKRYRAIVEYKYSKYLEKKYIELLLKKIDILEHELKMKIIIIQEEMMYEKQENNKSK